MGQQENRDDARSGAAGSEAPRSIPSGSIVKDGKGTYRWVYEYSLLTNPTIFLTVAKVLLGCIVGVGVFMLAMRIPDFVRGYADASDVAFTFELMGVMVGIFAVLTVIGYGIFAAMQGGKYCVLFTMDNESVTFEQMPKEVKIAEAIGLLNVLAGLAGGKPAQVGLGMSTAARSSMTSTFSAVRSIKGSRRLQVIKVNEPFAKNQVYVRPEDYDFVFGFIRDHCPNATKVEG